MKLIFLVLPLFVTSVSFASSRNNRDTSLYGGFGFGYSDVSLKPLNSDASNFSGWHGILEVGTNITFNAPFGVNIAGEYKVTDVENELDSATYMETAKMDSMAVKLGLYWGNYTVGAGYSKTTIDIKNVAFDSAGETTTYKGSPILFYANYGFENDQLRAVVEAQYASKTLDDKDIEYKDLSFGLRIFYLFSK